MTITVRRARVDDAAAMARLMGDPEVYPGLLQMPYPSEELHRARLVDSLAPGKPDILLVAERGGEDERNHGARHDHGGGGAIVGGAGWMRAIRKASMYAPSRST